MTATRETLSRWFDEGARGKATHMAVFCGTFDHTTYPVYVTAPTPTAAKEAVLDEADPDVLVEVYHLASAKEAQLNARRALNYEPLPVERYVFWGYDLYPYVLHSEAFGPPDERGRLKLGSKYNGGWVKPLLALPPDEGRALGDRIDALRREYEDHLAAFEESWGAMLKAELPSELWPSSWKKEDR